METQPQVAELRGPLRGRSAGGTRPAPSKVGAAPRFAASPAPSDEWREKRSAATVTAVARRGPFARLPR